MSDSLGDRMKLYESAECGRKLMPLLPILARIDGRAFHAFTRGMERPYSSELIHCMVETTKYLVRETGARMGYTQSDEITLAWHSTDAKSQVWFDGKIHKMVSQLAAQATLEFNNLIACYMPDYAPRRPTFDARVWNVPTRWEGANVFLWREWDASKNSITMAAQAYYSHAELHGKHSADKHDMLIAKGINWNDYPVSFKRGVYVQRRAVTGKFSADELADLPPKHHAHTNPDLTIERSEVRTLSLPPLGTIGNREAVIFCGHDPACPTDSASARQEET